MARQDIKGIGYHADPVKLHGYAFTAPNGEWTGRLDERAWGKSSNLFCYFTDTATGQAYRLSVFSSHGYKPYGGGPAFDQEPLGTVFRIKSGMSKNGLPKLLSAEPVPQPGP